MSDAPGDLVHSRVVADVGDALATALDRELTGFARFTPQDALLLGGEGEGWFVFRDGVPVRARHTGTGRDGPDAVADLADNGPYRVELYDAPPDDRGGPVAPRVPAELLAADPALADRVAAAAPASDAGAESADAVTAFLENEERIDAIRDRAREEAERRAEEWGFDDLL